MKVSRFECFESGSRKFYEIRGPTPEGAGFRVDRRWGRIGSAGSVKTTYHATIFSAQAEVMAEREKRYARGYNLVNEYDVDKPAKLPAPKPAPAPIQAVPQPAPMVAPQPVKDEEIQMLPGESIIPDGLCSVITSKGETYIAKGSRVTLCARRFLPGDTALDSPLVGRSGVVTDLDVGVIEVGSTSIRIKKRLVMAVVDVPGIGPVSWRARDLIVDEPLPPSAPEEKPAMKPVVAHATDLDFLDALD